MLSAGELLDDPSHVGVAMLADRFHRIQAAEQSYRRFDAVETQQIAELVGAG